MLPDFRSLLVFSHSAKNKTKQNEQNMYRYYIPVIQIRHIFPQLPFTFVF